jgi:hypothetical protein
MAESICIITHHCTATAAVFPCIAANESYIFIPCRGVRVILPLHKPAVTPYNYTLQHHAVSAGRMKLFDFINLKDGRFRWNE